MQFICLAGGALGTLIGTPFADRFGARKVLLTSLTLLLPVQFVLTWLTGWALFVGLFAAGFLIVSTIMVTLILVQAYMPRNVGLAAGLSLGVGFGLGGMGTMVLGLLASGACWRQKSVISAGTVTAR